MEQEKNMKQVVALVGRPNVGKSTLFNRLTHTKDALVDNFPGVTRDRNFGNVRWDGMEFTLVDTGGFADADQDVFAPQIRMQIQQAVEDADAVILLMDGKNGLSPFDTDLIDLLRPLPKQVFFTVNKIDSPEQEENLHEFFKLGIETLYPLSAAHGYGIHDLLDALVDTMPKDLPAPDSDQTEDVIKVAVVGRPNVGKSSLVNRIIGENRLLVSDIPGTTRDSVDTVCEVDGRKFLFIDTAGIRRKGKVSRKIEKFSVIKALKSLDRCDVALILMDASEGITDQDMTIAGYAYDRGCGCMLLLNKWDLMKKGEVSADEYRMRVRDAAGFLGFAPIMTLSAKTGMRVRRIFKSIQQIFSQYTKRIGTGQVNKILEKAIMRNEPSLHKGKRLKFYYATQVSEKPPTFVLFVSHPAAVHFSYRRYLINRFREDTGLTKCPIRLLFRQRTGHISFKKKKKVMKLRKHRSRK